MKINAKYLPSRSVSILKIVAITFNDFPILQSCLKIASGMLLPDFAFSCNNLRQANVNKRYIICFTFYTLNSVYIFSKLFSIHFLGYWQRDFVEQTRAFLICDNFLHSCDHNVWFRGVVSRNYMLVTLMGQRFEANHGPNFWLVCLFWSKCLLFGKHELILLCKRSDCSQLAFGWKDNMVQS